MTSIKLKQILSHLQSRSIAFKKEAWEQVNGYPEWLPYAEDSYFYKKLREIGKKFFINKKAIVLILKTLKF